MANPTTNYGFIMPSSTDLVTDLPADFDVFGQAVDTQMLTNANAAIAKAIVDAKGDLISATAADTPARLAVGANGTVLTADSTETTGLKWAAASGGKVLQVVAANTTTQTANSTTTMADTTLTATITPTSATSTILVLVSQNGLLRGASNSNNAININLLRGATVISQIMSTGLYTDTALLLTGFSASANYLDSPATTSATTYKTQFSQRFASADVRVQQASDMSSIVLLEIGA